jgi:beta-mannanase
MAAAALPPARPMPFGVYDPSNHFRNSPQPDIEHVFVYWQALDRKMLAAKMRLAEQRSRTLMVTVEPYTKAANWRDGGHRLLADVRRGRFDREIEAVCAAIAAFPGAHWIRWGHEMEEPSERYPWAGRDAASYVSAYRYFVDACKKIAPRALFIWSPKGERGLEAYYPGADYVDMTGVALWGLETWDRAHYGRPRTFGEAFGEKYRRLEGFAKPVVIAEFGLAGGEQYKRAWSLELFSYRVPVRQFPLLAGIVYFNDKEPHVWPAGFGSPDWRTSPSLVAAARRLALSRE